MRVGTAMPSEALGFSLLAWARGQERVVPVPVSSVPSCRLRDLPPHPPRALHRLYPAVQWAPLRGTGLPQPSSTSLSSLLPLGWGAGRH